MKMLTLSALLLAACASGVGQQGPCGNRAPVRMTVDSNHFADTVVRDTNGVRLGLATGHSVTHLRYCVGYPVAATFTLDPIAERPYDISAGGVVEAGSSVAISIGSDVAISFVTVTPP